MRTLPPLEEQLAMAGLTYGKRHDISYRAGLVLQALGAGGLAVLYPMGSPFYSAGIMAFEAGALLSAVYLLVWMSWVRKIILWSALGGIALQVAGYHAPPEYAGSVLIAGAGLVCAAGAGLAGKEAYCHGWREGWALMWLYAVLATVNLFGKEYRVFNSLGFSAAFLLLLSLTGRKLKQPLLTPCGANVCGEPEKKSNDR